MSNQKKAFYSLILASLIASGFTAGVKALASAEIPPVTIAWFRFVTGFVLYFAVQTLRGKPFPKINHYGWMSLRAVTNFVAVSFFYLAIQNTTLVKANLLNMTYPIFIALFAPFMLKERTGGSHWLAVSLSFIGVILVVGYDLSGLQLGDMYGLICGFLASISLIGLRGARQFDDANTIVFYVMLMGTVGLLPFIDLGIQLDLKQSIILLLTSLGGVAGQFFLTFSYKYTSALTGAITGMARLVFSAALGLMFFAESIHSGLVFGSSLIVFSIFLLNKKR